MKRRGHNEHLDQHIPPAKRQTHWFVWGWKGLVRREANLGPVPEPGRPLYGQAAKDEVERFERAARQLGVRIGPYQAWAFKRVKASEAPLKHRTWLSVIAYLERRTVERAGVPWWWSLLG